MFKELVIGVIDTNGDLFEHMLDVLTRHYGFIVYERTGDRHLLEVGPVHPFTANVVSRPMFVVERIDARSQDAFDGLVVTHADLEADEEGELVFDARLQQFFIAAVKRRVVVFGEQMRNQGRTPPRLSPTLTPSNE